jgi:hypothetical protein
MRFKPRRKDGRSFRDVAVDLLKNKDPGTVVSYGILAAELEVDPRADRSKIQATVRIANKTLLKLYQRAVTNVPTVGYRVLQAREHMLVASGHESKADRAMGVALRFYEGTNLAEMTETERKLHQGQHMLAVAIIASHRHLDKQHRRLEELVTGIDQRQRRVEDDLEELRQRQ